MRLELEQKLLKTIDRSASITVILKKFGQEGYTEEAILNAVENLVRLECLEIVPNYSSYNLQTIDNKTEIPH